MDLETAMPLLEQWATLQSLEATSPQVRGKLFAFLDLPAEIRNHIYEAILEKLQLQREARDQSNSKQEHKQHHNPLRFKPDVYLPSMHLLLASKLIYREFAPLFYRHLYRDFTATSITDVECLELMTRRSANINTSYQSPLMFVEAMYLAIPTPCSQEIASHWFSALQGLAQFSTRQRLTTDSQFVKSLTIKFIRERPHWNCRPPPGTTWNFDGEKFRSPKWTPFNSDRRDTQSDHYRVELDKNIALVILIARIQGLERLKINGGSSDHWPKLLDEHHDQDLALRAVGHGGQVADLQMPGRGLRSIFKALYTRKDSMSRWTSSSTTDHVSWSLRGRQDSAWGPLETAVNHRY